MVGPAKEKVLLVGCFRGRDGHVEALESLDELRLLAQTAGGSVVSAALQERRTIDPATFIGKGKAEEIGMVCREQAVDLVLFDEDLSPAQARNLEKLTGVRVIDRSQLILDIFALGARTSVARAQVELAQLEYMLPRLTRMWEHLSRTGGGIGTRGPGETQLEVDRRRIRRRIFTLKRVLKKVEQDHVVRTARRKDFPKASLVGYTNAGKSTLFNQLARANVATGNRLFETLDTTTRLVKLPSRESILLSDTVGFIRKLPHHLVASFHATLECVVEADLVVHVADISHPNHEAQIATVRSVLGELGAGSKPEILILNKIDCVSNGGELRRALRIYEDAVPMSALTGSGLDALADRLLKFVTEPKREVLVRFPRSDDRTFSYIQKYGKVLASEVVDGDFRLSIRMDRKLLKSIEAYVESGPEKQA
ncbi:MAG TPA: GTPase HflX [bacterium]|nr:GTPase HflX [bacterium]